MNESHPLAQLIQETQDRNGWSTRDLERIADRHGYSMKHSNFSRLKSEPVVAIKASQIRILSKVLGVSEQLIARAAINSMGVDLDATDIGIRDVLRSSNELTSRDRRILLSVIDAMHDDESGTNAEHTQPQTNTPPRLRAVAPTDHPGQGQKTTPADNSSAGDDIELQLDQLGIKQLHGSEAEEFPVPGEQDLAALKDYETDREKFDRIHGERGEENQEDGQ